MISDLLFRPRSHANFFHNSGKKFWDIGKNFAVTRKNFSELPKKILNYEQRIEVHDWPHFFGNSKSSRIAMGTSPNDFPLNKMPLTHIFCLKPAYLLAFTISQDGEAWTGRPHRKGHTRLGQDAPPGCSPYQGAMSVCKPAVRLPNLPRGPNHSAFSNAEA